MKKKIIAIITSLLFAVLIIVCNINSTPKRLNATATSTTYAIDIRYHDLCPTQDAYIPEKAVVGIGLKTPCDIIVDDYNNIYICDSGNRNIVMYDNVNKSIAYTLTYKDFKTPKGIYIKDNKYLYVADSSAERIFIFEKNNLNEFEYLKEFGKPTSPLFEKNDFKPSKIAVDRSGIMFVIGETVLDGIIKLSTEGAFLGYFSSNKVNKSLKEKMQELIYDDEILDLLGSTQPPTFNNVYADSKGLIYSTTSYTKEDTISYPRIKKHATNGKNLIDAFNLYDDSPTDIFVGSNGVMYVSWNNGYITTYTEEGELLFCFGGHSNNDIAGLFSQLTAIAVDTNNNIWCLDSKKAAIHQFVPTQYTTLMYEAFDLYSKRDYKASIDKWNEVLSLNQVSAIAHNQIGLNYLYSQDYETAMKHLKLAGDRENYSQAFWEVRNRWLQSNLTTVIICLVSLLVLVFVYKTIKVKLKLKNLAFIDKIKDSKFVNDMKFNVTVLKQPYDSFYYVKTNKRGSTLSCIITMIVIFFIFLWYTLGKGFIFQWVSVDDVDIIALLAGYFGLIGLLTVCNWLVSSIQDGEAGFLAVFRTVVISLIPFGICMVVVTLLSYVATANEVFLLDFIYYLGIGLTLLTLFMGIQNVHFYTFKKTITSILLTLLLMFVIILVLLLVIILTTQLYQFIEVLIKEVFR